MFGQDAVLDIFNVSVYEPPSVSPYRFRDNAALLGPWYNQEHHL